MFPRLRPVLWSLVAATVWLAAPGEARADSVHYAYHLTQDDAAGSGAPAPVTTSASLSDVTGPATAVTLPELLLLAVRQSPSLERALIDIEVAEAQMEQSRGLDDWTVGADLSVSLTKRPDWGAIVTASGDITKLLPSGGSISLHVEADRRRASTTSYDIDLGPPPRLISETTYFTAYTDTVTATWVQPLLRGRGRDIFLASQAQARIARDAAALARSQQAIAVIRDTVSAYWDLVLAQRELDISRSSLALAAERLRITQAAIKGGKVAATEALAVEQVIATREEEILGNELNVLNRSIELRRLVNMEIGPGQLGLSAETDLGVPSRAWDLDALIEDAFRTSPELALLATQAAGAEIEVEVTENGVLPALDFSLTLGPTGSDDSFGGALVKTAKFDDIIAVASLSYQQSLGNHEASGRSRAARAERRRVMIDEVDTRAQIALSLAQAVVLATSAERRVAIAGRAIGLAEQNIVAEQSRFGLGKATNFDVLTRQDELKQAQLRQARAIVDWHKSATLISAITGDLLTRYGITLSDK